MVEFPRIYRRKPDEITPFHHLRIVERLTDQPDPYPPEKTGIVATHVFLDGKELHCPCDSEVRIAFGAEELVVAYIPVVVASVHIEKEEV